MSIKCEVIVDGDYVCLGNYEIYIEVSMCDVYKDHQYQESFETLEQAIKYCMEQSK